MTAKSKNSRGKARLQTGHALDSSQEGLLRRRQMDSLWRLHRSLTGKVEVTDLVALCGSLATLRV
jgi:hypothetical protein